MKKLSKILLCLSLMGSYGLNATNIIKLREYASSDVTLTMVSLVNMTALPVFFPVSADNFTSFSINEAYVSNPSTFQVNTPINISRYRVKVTNFNASQSMGMYDDTETHKLPFSLAYGPTLPNIVGVTDASLYEDAINATTDAGIITGSGGYIVDEATESVSLQYAAYFDWDDWDIFQNSLGTGANPTTLKGTLTWTFEEL